MSDRIDYKEVAEILNTLRDHEYGKRDKALDAAIDLCERMATGELVERELRAEPMTRSVALDIGYSMHEFLERQLKNLR